MKILHAADLHLDSPFRGLAAEEARQRRQESRRLPGRLRDLANDSGAELVLLSGDLFDGENVYRDTLEQLKEALGAIRCPVVIAPGNHDPYHPGSPYAKEGWPENVRIFTSPRPQALELAGCTVYGAAFTAPRREDGPLAGFSAPADGKLRLMCLHGDLSPGSPYGPVSREEIAASGLHYLALGHVHQFSGLQRAGGTYYAYPGCPEGRGFDELGEKGVLLGTVEEGRTALAFVPLAGRRYEILTVCVTDREPAEAVEEAVASCRPQDLLRVVLTGETGERGAEVKALEERFAGRFAHLELVDDTRVGGDIWARAGEDSLRGLFLRQLRAQYDAAGSEEERRAVTAAVRMGLAALDNRDF